jgi:plasmid stabilization system protein ParE
MMRRLVFRPEAAQEIGDAAAWHEDQREGLGVRFLAEVERFLDHIAENPHACGEVEPGVRRGILRRFPYGIYYSTDDDAVVVLAVLHFSRHPDTWKRQA